MKKISFEKEFVKRNEKKDHILRFMREAIGVDEVTFDDITVANIRKVKQYLLDNKANNSAVTYMAIIKATIHQFEEDGLLQHRNYGIDIKVKKTESENVVLTEEELDRIIAYYRELMQKPNHQAEKDVLTLFLVESFTGARQGDAEMLTLDNIRDGNLVYISHKTKHRTVLPVHSMLEELLRNMPKKKYSITTKARTIKRVAEKCGITQMVTIKYRGKFQTISKSQCLSTHSARRYLATTLDSHGVQLTEISRYMGHNSANMTMKYIVSDGRKASLEALSFFNG